MALRQEVPAEEEIVPGVQPPGSPARARTVNIAAALAVVYVLWGSTYLGIRLALDTLPPFLMASLRFLIAGGLLFAWSVFASRVRTLPSARQWLAAAVVGLVLLTAGNGGVSWAEQYVPTSTTALIISTTPIWMAILGRLFWHDRLHFIAGIGIAVGFGGMALLVWPAGGFSFDPRGTVVLFFASVSWATGSLYARHAPAPGAPGMGSAMQMLAGGVALLVISIGSGDIRHVNPAHLSATSVLALAYLVIFGSLVAYSCYTWLLHHARISLVSTYAYVNPVVAVLLGTLFLQERLTPKTLLAAAVIVVSVAIIVSAPRRQAAHA